MKKGQYVKHPLRSDWGTGEVLDVSGNKATVNFEHAGLKRLDITIVSLDNVKDAAPVPFRIDMEELENLCNRFHADLEHNRKGYDDGRIASLVLDDVKRRGLPTEENKKRLLDWCHTDGNVFQSGVALAREICTAVYGMVLPDPDKMKEK
jgi:hypothetical protein